MKKIIIGVTVAIYLAIMTPVTDAQAPVAEKPEVVVPKKLTQDEIIVLIKTTFQDAPVMVKIADAESQYCTKNINTKSSARGCYQILKGTFEDPHYGCSGDRMNPVDNIACARKIYDRDGTIPWNASKHIWSA